MLSNKQKALKKEISYFFQKLMQRILYKIDKEWDTEIINIQEYADMVDLVHKDYYDILYKYTESEYNRARKIAEKKVDRQITRMVTKSKKDVPIKINKIEEEKGLWGTIPETRTDIEHMTFVASDKTLEKVKADKITKILHKGYTEGLNGKEVGRHIRVGFSKLKGYEAERIARTELHSAHEKGLLDQYKDMNVKYKQWDAHIDRRTRDEHIHLNGEITTIDGTFSNGLKNPGDKNGPIKEWINCRCTSDPYLMPIGKQAPPGATHFREEDLIDVDVGFNLDDYTLEDAITGNWGQVTAQVKKPELLEFGLTLQQQEELNELLQLKKEGKLKFLQKRQLKRLNDQIELSELHYKKSLNKLTPEEERKYKKLYKQFKAKLKTVKTKVLGTKYTERTVVLRTAYTPEEQFIQRDYGEVVISLSKESMFSFEDFINYYNDLPPSLKRNLQHVKVTAKSTNKSPLSYYSGVFKNTNKEIVLFPQSKESMRYTFFHESAHLWERMTYGDINYGYSMSSSKAWAKAVDQDSIKYRTPKKDADGNILRYKNGKIKYRNPKAMKLVSKYATDYHRKHKGGQTRYKMYSEDFAESVAMFFNDRKQFKKDFPNRYKVLKKVLL